MKFSNTTTWLRTPAAAEHLNGSVSWLNKLRMTGDGPLYSKLGRIVLYNIDDLDRWVTANRRHSTSEDASAPGLEGRDYDEPEVIERPEARLSANP